MSKIWVLVTDSSTARILTADSSVGPLVEQETMTHPEARQHERELTSDRPGRGKGNSDSRHNMELSTDPKDQENIYFSKRIAERLREADNHGEFDTLYIVAAPALLGTLRQHLKNNINKKISGELSKNLAHLPVEQIRQHLPERIPTSPV